MQQLSKLIPDPLDIRDYLFESEPGDILFGDNPNVTLPNAVDLRNFCSPVTQQAGIGCCTAATVCDACEMFDSGVERSKLFNYKTSRAYLEAYYQQNDAGSTARLAIKAAANAGLPGEVLWPYDLSKWNDTPPQSVFDSALLHKVGEYRRIQTIGAGESYADMKDRVIKSMKYTLARGWPVEVAGHVGRALQTLTTGAIYPPLYSDGNPLWGDHMFLVVGYSSDESGEYWICKNSWGTAWGEGGYFKVYIDVPPSDLQDIWVIYGFNGKATVGPNQIMYPVKPPPTVINAFVLANLAMPQLIVTQAVWFRLTAWEIESAVGWPAGNIRLYRDTDQTGMTLDWSGFIF